MIKHPSTRREFFADVGRGVLVATLGTTLASDLGIPTAFAEETAQALHFGELEPLVCLMQETPAKQLLPKLVEQLRSGKTLDQLVSAAALANARTFGGEDYIGFHTMMAMTPALRMSRELPKESQALPVFKVLYRNTARIQERGGRSQETLQVVQPSKLPADRDPGEYIRSLVRGKDIKRAEQALATIANHSPEDAFNSILCAVQDDAEVHRVVMPYRAWDLVGVIGKEQAHTLLRQSVHYCARAENSTRATALDSPRSMLPKLLEQYKLLSATPGNRTADAAWIDQLSQTIFKSTPEHAAEAVAAALAEGFSVKNIGEALSLAANQLILRDNGRTPRDEVVGKPPGSVHGDSIGVHASDSANAWRNMSLESNPRNSFSCLIVGAFQMASDRVNRGGDFLNWEPLPVQRHLSEVRTTDATELLREAEEAIRGNLQGKATAIIHKYGLEGHDARPVFDLMLKYAISEDGALHAEKFYRTVSEEYAAANPAFRWRYLVALARVTASEYGRPAAGVAEARELLKV
ncbi:MAG: hypothetical protein JWN25_1737 [Verrucomicrobiales bacterium]|nr:hypothetical protein [Verrucomicrobiales bacterium]